MSIAQSPLLGPMKGSMGNFTVYMLNNKVVVRSKAFNIKDAKTANQLNVRARIALMAKMYQGFESIIRLGFPENSEKKSPQNMFLKNNFKTAFETVDHVPQIRYPWLLLSQGSLPEVKVLDAVINDEGILIRYDAGLLPDVLFATDEIIVCARLITGALLIARQIRGYEAIETILLKRHDLVVDKIECCYAFVRSGDGKKASNSVYVEIKG